MDKQKIVELKENVILAEGALRVAKFYIENDNEVNTRYAIEAAKDYVDRAITQMLGEQK